MDGFIKLETLNSLRTDLLSGDVKTIYAYIEEVINSPIQSAQDPNLDKLFELFLEPALTLTIDIYEMDELFSVPKRVLTAIFESEEAFSAIKKNEKLGNIILMHDYLLGSTPSGDLDSEYRHESRVLELASI